MSRVDSAYLKRKKDNQLDQRHCDKVYPTLKWWYTGKSDETRLWWSRSI